MNRSNRRRHKQLLRYSIVIGLLVAGLLALLVWFKDRPPGLPIGIPKENIR